jgi:hypothetical protein
VNILPSRPSSVSSDKCARFAFVIQSQSKSVRTINIYCNEKVVRDLGELRNKWALWRKIGTISLQQHQACACCSETVVAGEMMRCLLPCVF